MNPIRQSSAGTKAMTRSSGPLVATAGTAAPVTRRTASGASRYVRPAGFPATTRSASGNAGRGLAGQASSSAARPGARGATTDARKSYVCHVGLPKPRQPMPDTMRARRRDKLQLHSTGFAKGWWECTRERPSLRRGPFSLVSCLWPRPLAPS